MTFKIESCWSGGDKFKFRAIHKGQRYVIPSNDGKWTRKTASEMRDLLEVEGFERENIRFQFV